MSTRLSPERYFELIDRDTDRLITIGERGLREAVPACDGWDVGEVVWHVATVYEHKIRVMADNAWPDPWPPAWEFADDEELAFLRNAKARLFEEFSRHDLTEPTQTFGDDTTIAFWVRRMACEVAVHRYDGEAAHADPTPIPDDLALDGIDEMLHVMLSGDWWKERKRTEHPVDARVAVEAAGHRWVCDVRGESVLVATESTEPTAATVSAPPMDLFLWLWGRADDDRVTVSGDEHVAQEFRSRLAECSG